MSDDAARFDEPGFKRVDLWYTYLANCADEALLEEYRRMLTDEERQQELRFRFPGGREQYLVTRVLSRTVLSHYTGRDPAQWRFVRGRWGKPAVDSASGPAPSFNLSNTAGLVVCAVTSAADLGVDAEDTRRRTEIEGMARRCMAADELTAFAAQPADLRPQRFFRLWTLKEALLKAHGTGFSVGPEKFSIRLEPGQPPRLIDPGPLRALIDVDPARWQLAEFRLGDYYRLAIAVPLPVEQRLRILVRQTVPLRRHDPGRMLPDDPAASWALR